MKICLVGNQNCGKTTLFNLLTGLNQKIGNWPGVTIEKKTGIIRDTNFELIDLPGIYSLIPYTEEEEITKNYILNENPDLVINIIDAAHLERSLYLTIQLLEIGCNVIIALNMIDILNKKGIEIDSKTMQRELNIPICEISALKQTGIENLIEEIERIDLKLKNMYKVSKKVSIQTTNIIYNYSRFIKISNIDEYEKSATARYNYISNIKSKFWKRKKKWIDNTEILDKIFLNKIISIPIFMAIMFIIYFVSVGVVGKYTTNLVSEGIDRLSILIEEILINLNFKEWTRSLILDGVLKGVGSVLGFIPQLVILFFCISVLETTGYMARIAFLLDNIFKKVGLNGKSLIPFIIGCGCSVPGIMSTKIIEQEDEKKMTSILVPFVPCSAKLPIIALFSGYFFKENAGLISASLYFLSIIVIIISSLLMKKYIFRSGESSFIFELPDYKIPSIKYVVKDVLDKVNSFIKKAGSTILIASIVIWFLLTYSTKLKYGVPIEESILAFIGKKISFVFYPIVGRNSWELTVSALQGLIAKEQVVSSMSIISGLSNTSNTIFEISSPFGFLNKASAYAYVIFNLFSAPCFASILAMRNELKSTKKVILAIGYQITLAWLLSSGIYAILRNF